MSSIFIMVGASLLIAGGFLAAFIWSVKNKQYNDIYGDAIRPVLDNEPENKSSDSTAIH